MRLRFLIGIANTRVLRGGRKTAVRDARKRRGNLELIRADSVGGGRRRAVGGRI